MQKPVKKIVPILILIIAFFFAEKTIAQMITGTWKGKINRQKVEIKIIQKGDSLTGTSYYYESPNNYKRYSIAGYFDANTNEAVWWDDQLLEEKSTKFSITNPGKMPMLSRANFNCPGGSRMMLDGKTVTKENDRDIKGEVHMDKTYQSVFEDEWDFVIDNYTIGANDPDIIDSIKNLIAVAKPKVENPVTTTPEKKAIKPDPPIKTKTEEKPIVKSVPIKKVVKPVPVITEPIQTPTIEEKFVARKKTFTKEIPISGDSLELRFYDNGEIDGDSISLFLNNKLIFQHIRLTAAAYTIKLAISELDDINELTMVAENLGSIPPNTSYMVAIVNEQRYDAYLASSEGESAMIRLVKNR